MENTKKINVNSSLLFILTATLTGKVLGMLRDILLANYYGTGIEATAFVTASRIPLNFFDLAFGAIISSSFIPTFNKIYKSKGKEYSISFANDFISMIFMLSLFFASLGIAFAPFFVKLIAGGLKGEVYLLAVVLSKMMFPLLIFTAISFIFVGILQSFGEFKVPAAISIVSNLIIIIYFFTLNGRYGIKGLAISMVVGWFLQMLVQVPFLLKKDFKPRLRTRLRHKSELKSVIILMVPILISTWVQPINIFINTYIASTIGDGSGLVVLEYANRIFIIVAGVFILAVTNITFPSLARFIADDDFDSFTSLLKSSLSLVIYFMLPLTIGIFVQSKNIISLLFENGMFTSNETNLVSNALILYAISIVFYGIREIMNRAYYSYGDSKPPMYIAIIGIFINLGLSLYLISIYGIYGLPIATSITTGLMATALLLHFHFRVHRIFSYKIFTYISKIVIISAVMGLVIYLTEGYLLSLNSSLMAIIKIDKLVILLRILLGTVLGLLIYLVPCHLIGLKIPNMKIDN